MCLDRAERLNRLVLGDVSVLPELSEDILNDHGLVLSGSLVENVKVDSEPIVD